MAPEDNENFRCSISGHVDDQGLSSLGYPIAIGFP